MGGLMDEKFNMFMVTVDERFRSFLNQRVSGRKRL